METFQKNKIIGLSIFIIIIIFSFSFWFFLIREKEPKKPSLPKFEPVEAIPDVPGDCEKIKDLTLRQHCLDRKKLSDILYRKNNFNACFEIKDEGILNECLFRIARRKENIKECLRIPKKDYKDLCIQEVAILQNKPEICDHFKKEPYETQECKDRVKATNVHLLPQKTIDLDYCASIKTLEYSKLCMLNAMRAGKGIKGKTRNLDFALTWNAMIQYVEATKKEDCQKIEHQGAKKACLEKIKHPEYLYFDYDKDGIRDHQELWFGTDPAKKDTDKDGLDDFEEMQRGINPTNPDTDQDGVSDKKEIKKGTDPLRPLSF
jgi:hypothetical protein